MKNIKSKLFGFVAAVVVALSLPATGHSQILYNGYFNIDWQYNWPLGDSYADKSSGWGMNFEGGYYFPRLNRYSSIWQSSPQYTSFRSSFLVPVL